MIERVVKKEEFDRHLKRYEHIEIQRDNTLKNNNVLLNFKYKYMSGNKVIAKKSLYTDMNDEMICTIRHVYKIVEGF